MGETFDEWQQRAGLVERNVCAPHDRRDKSMDYKGVCRTLKAIRASGRGNFQTSAGGNSYLWYFLDGKVAQTEVIRGGGNLLGDDATVEMNRIASAYGKPTKTRVVVYENAFGAKWDCLQAEWDLPDGAAIVENETVEDVHGPMRLVSVTFYSAEQLRSMAARQNARQSSNPYK